MSSSTAGVAKQGPWGISGERTHDTGIFTRLTKFTVNVHGNTGMIRGVWFHYEQNGTPQSTGYWGSGTGSPTHVDLQPNEYLIAISGTLDGSLKSFTLKSNQRTFGPFGRGGNTSFNVAGDQTNKIVGFHGSNSSNLLGGVRSIGVYMGPIVPVVIPIVPMKPVVPVIPLVPVKPLVPDKLDECLKARDDLEKEVAKLTVEKTGLQTEAGKTNQELVLLADENSYLKDKADKDKKDREEFEKSIAKLKDQIDALKADIENKKQGQCCKNQVSLIVAMDDTSKVSVKLSSKASDMTDTQGKTFWIRLPFI